MGFFPVPARTRGQEILDDPATPDEVRVRAMRDVARSNVLFGGTRAVLRELLAVGNELPRNAVLVDVGTGTGDIPAAARATLASYGFDVHAIGVDASEPLLQTARLRVQGAVAGNALRLPLKDDCADVVTCSQLLHHFFDHDPATLVAELHRVSRGWVIISDLQRSWLAAGGFWLASSALRFHEVTRLDGMTSVLRGFERTELEELVHGATGVTAIVRTGMFWRVTARWRARSSMGALH
jgi:SAM-dependent methyltransferase